MNKRDHVVNAVVLSLGVAVLFAAVPTTGTVRVPFDAPTASAAAVAVAGEFVRFGVPVTLGALFPDVDTHFGRHRKTLHNGLVLGLFVAYPVVYDNLDLVWLGVATHLLLDAAGSGRGVAFLYPLSDREFGLPGGVPTRSPLSTPVTVLVTAVELAAVAVVHYFLVPLDGDVAASTARAVGGLAGGDATVGTLVRLAVEAAGVVGSVGVVAASVVAASVVGGVL